MLPGLIFGLLACHRDDPERGPAPWDSLATIPLRVFSPLMTQSATGTQLARLKSTQLTLVVESDQIRVLDARYHHYPGPTCLNATLWAFDPTGRQGGCATDEIEVRRGLLTAAGSTITGVATYQDDIYFLNKKGALFTASGNVEIENPYDYLRPVLKETLEQSGMLAISPEGVLAVAEGSSLWVAPDTEYSLEGTALQIGWDEGGLRVLTDTGLWWDETWVTRAAQDMAIAGESTLLAGEDGLFQVQKVGSPKTISNQPVRQVAVGTHLVGATDRELIAWDWAGVELDRTDVSGVVDLLVSTTDEVVGLQEDGTVQVFLDELALQDERPPLKAAITAFFERPRKESDDVDCSGEESVKAFVERAVGQKDFLADLPFPVALGVTTWGARRIAECKQDDTFAPLLEQSTVGVLYHYAPEECGGDVGCYEDFLRTERGYVLDLGQPATWMTGVAPHEDLGLDWVAGMQSIGGPMQMLFPGMSFLPGVDHDTDPRAKDSWPWRVEELGTARHLGAASDFGEVTSEGEMTVFPGDNIPVYSLSGCPNLFLWECYTTGGGGGKTVTAEDVVQLSLMLHRAIAMRGEGASWTFHLPDLGLYDYTEGCTERDRLWSGEDCSAAVLQSWALDRWQRYIPAGIVIADVP